MRKYTWGLILSLLLFVAPVSAAPRRVEVRGGWYGEALTTGEMAVAVPSQHMVVTHLGNIPQNGDDDPLYVRVAPNAPFRFAGQGHNTGQTEEWNGTWTVKPTACGVSPLIYDAAGVLHLSDCSIGSQGWRYVEDGTGRLVTGDQSFASPALNLFEYTIHGDLAIGQGANGGCVAVRGVDRRVIEPGDCRFVRFNRTGDQIAVTMVKLFESKTVILFASVNDLPTFPVETSPVVTPPPPPSPPADTLQGGNQKSVVVQVMKDHPEIDTCDENSLDKGRAIIVDWAAQRLNASAGKVVWGRKSRGKPTNGVADRPNTDALTFLRDDGRFEIYDVISGAPPCGATWDGDTIFAQGQNGFWVKPQLRAEGTSTVPPPPPVDPRIAQLEEKLAFVQGALKEARQMADERFLRIEALEAERDDLKGQIERLDAALEAAKVQASDPCSRVRVRVVPSSLARFVGTRCEVK